MKKPGINLSEVKERNRASVLRLLCTAPSITRSELSERLCLSPMTVTNITSELLGARLIEEVTPCSHAKTPGRTPMLLRIAPDSPVVAGVLLTKCNVFGILSDLSLRPLGRAHCTLDEGETEQSILKKIFSIVRQLLACTTRPCCGLGISSAGVVNPENSGIAYITDFFGVQSMELREPLEARFGFPVYVYNDMQAAGLCELYFGWGRQEESFLYVGVTNGLGAATVTHHEPLDACGEMGHISVDSDGPHCNCGSNGCLELYASTTAILHRIEQECGVRPANLSQAVQLAMRDRTAYTIFYNAASRLAYGINNYLNLISVPLVILGHDGAFLPDELLGEMEKLVVRMNVAMHQNRTRPRFVRSSFGDEAPMLGSICTVLLQMFRGSYPIERLLAQSAGAAGE